MKNVRKLSYLLHQFRDKRGLNYILWESKISNIRYLRKFVKKLCTLYRIEFIIK